MNELMRKSFKAKYGEWAVVTGASSGIGKAFAIELAKIGLNIILVARSQEKLSSVADVVLGYGVAAKIFIADLSNQADTEALHKFSSDMDVGLLVAAAGFGTSGEFVNGNLANELEMIDVNCRSLAASTHYFAESFKNRGGGVILLSSIVAFQGNANSANYSATKAYVQSLAEGLSSELKAYDIDVLSCAPGPTASGFANRAKMKLGATIEPETVAKKSIAALGRKTTVLPGLLSKVLKNSMFGLPRWGRSLIMSKVMTGMTKHQRA